MRRFRFIQEFMSKYQEDVIYNDKLRVVVCLKTSEVTKRMSKTFLEEKFFIFIMQ